MENIIEVRKLYHSYGKHVIYEGLNFTVERGRIFGLLGKNGVGKTTLINILMGFLHPTSGRCLVLGEDSHNLSPETRGKIGLLHEGHLAYEFMTIAQIERYYSGYYHDWNRDWYYELIDMMGLSYNHKISKMSCGQRSQVVLGLILAQNPELMILDDYSMGLGAGYRRLFLDYLTEYVKNGDKTVFVTSHIVQDLEKLVDDIIFIGKGGYLLQTLLIEFMDSFKQYRFKNGKGVKLPGKDDIIKNVEIIGDKVSVYTFESKEPAREHLMKKGVETVDFEEVPMTLEDAFIGLMGRY
ncbi:MAG: ABC transporter ATP-binding protein [Deltaproteobacteria bacterium]|nr:ABC transporter ATP-binding protein [Deltaproteobacteria bacterium]